MNLDPLGAPYEQREQGGAMVFAAAAWAGFLLFNTASDFIPKDSLISALVRIGSLLCMIGAVIAIYVAFPRSMRLAKTAVVVLAFTGIATQLLAVTDLITAQPRITTYFDTLLISQLLFNMALLPFSYCLAHHPLFPRWLGGALLIDGMFWLGYYWLVSDHILTDLWAVLLPIPFWSLEFFTGVLFVRNGLRLLKLSQPKEHMIGAVG